MLAALAGGVLLVFVDLDGRREPRARVELEAALVRRVEREARGRVGRLDVDVLHGVHGRGVELDVDGAVG